MSRELLLIRRTDNVLTLTINRPEKRNALRMDLLDEIGSACQENASDDTLKYAVLTASGDDCFAAGGDLQELDKIRSRKDAAAMSRRGREALRQVRDFPLPVVAAMNGLAYGGGAELAMACDFRVAVPTAEIGFLQAELNVTTAWGGGIDLIGMIGRQRALDLLLSAKRLSARQASELGLVDYVCRDNQDLEGGLLEFVAAFNKRSSRVLRGFKSIASAHRRTMHDALSASEEAAFITSWTHPDHWAAVEKAFRPRAKPE